MFCDQFLLANGRFFVGPLKGVVPEAVLFEFKGKQYWVYLGELKGRLSYDEAVQVAQKTKINGKPCSLMPSAILLAFFNEVKEYNAIRQRFGLREIPTETARFWGESKDDAHSYVVINKGHVSLKFRNGNLRCAYALPVLDEKGQHYLVNGTVHLGSDSLMSRL